VADRGYGAVLALAMMFGGVLLLGVAIDVARFVATWREAVHVAHTAAETGAGWVRPGDLYAGSLVIDPAPASQAARTVVDAAGMAATVSVTPRRLCVDVATSVEPRLGRLVGGLPQSVTATACAVPRKG